MNVSTSNSPAPADASLPAASPGAAPTDAADNALAALLASLGGSPAPSAFLGAGGKPAANFAQVLSGEVKLSAAPGPARGGPARASGGTSAAAAPSSLPLPTDGKKSRLPGGQPLAEPAVPAMPLPVALTPPADLASAPLPLPTPPPALAGALPVPPLPATSVPPTGSGPVAVANQAMGTAADAAMPTLPPDATFAARSIRSIDASATLASIPAVGPTPAPVPTQAVVPMIARLPLAESAAPSVAADLSAPQPVAGGGVALPSAVAPRLAPLRSDHRSAPAAPSGAKTAELLPAGMRRVEAATQGANKNLLNDNSKEDANVPAAVGMSSAEADAVMQSSPSLHLAAAALAPRGAFVALAPAPAPANAVATGHATTPAAAVQAAVAAVVQISDAQAARGEAGATSVNLGFKIGDEHLGVRVEMRNGEVRTQFTTDSNDLRAALSREWQAIAPAPAPGSAPMAEPVFAASGQATTDFGSPRERGEPPTSGGESSAGFARLAPKSPAPTAAAAAILPLAAPAGRLLTFA